MLDRGLEVAISKIDATDEEIDITEAPGTDHKLGSDESGSDTKLLASRKSSCSFAVRQTSE